MASKPNIVLILNKEFADLAFKESDTGTEKVLKASLNPQAQTRIQEFALKQNIQTLHNRINELGVAEPIIQQQGADRIVVQLPGVPDGEPGRPGGGRCDVFRRHAPLLRRAGAHRQAHRDHEVQGRLGGLPRCGVRRRSRAVARD